MRKYVNYFKVCKIYGVYYMVFVVNIYPVSTGVKGKKRTKNLKTVIVIYW